MKRGTVAGYYCVTCAELDRKCGLDHPCLCGKTGLVWMDGWVECEDCARLRITQERLKPGKEE